MLHGCPTRSLLYHVHFQLWNPHTNHPGSHPIPRLHLASRHITCANNTLTIPQEAEMCSLVKTHFTQFVRSKVFSPPGYQVIKQKQKFFCCWGNFGIDLAAVLVDFDKMTQKYLYQVDANKVGKFKSGKHSLSWSARTAAAKKILQP